MVFAAAHNAVVCSTREHTRNACGLFRAKIERQDWVKLTDADDDWARRAIAGLYYGVELAEVRSDHDYEFEEEFGLAG